MENATYKIISLDMIPLLLDHMDYIIDTGRPRFSNKGQDRERGFDSIELCIYIV